MNIKKIEENKKQFIELLLLADEQENMIDKYLDRGIMYALYDNDFKAICVVTDEGNGILEIKNIATDPAYQKKGYGKQLIQFVKDMNKNKYNVLQVGTGAGTLTVHFYEKCGFVKSHYIKNFFVDNYDHLMYEDGVQLVDMVYLQMKLNDLEVHN